MSYLKYGARNYEKWFNLGEILNFCETSDSRAAKNDLVWILKTKADSIKPKFRFKFATKITIQKKISDASK